jgi:hypothetical protein
VPGPGRGTVPEGGGVINVDGEGAQVGARLGVEKGGAGSLQLADRLQLRTSTQELHTGYWLGQLP